MCDGKQIIDSFRLLSNCFSFLLKFGHGLITLHVLKDEKAISRYFLFVIYHLILVVLKHGALIGFFSKVYITCYKSKEYFQEVTQ